MRFDMICKANGIEHRLTKSNHPWTTDEIEQPLSLLSCYFPQRGRPRGTERSARCELRHAARSPSFLICGARALLAALSSPVFSEAPIGAPGLFHLLTLGAPPFWKGVVVGAAFLPITGRLPGRELKAAQLARHQRRPSPGVVLALREHVPRQNGELSSDGDRRDMGPAPTFHTFVERSHRTGIAHRLPRGFDQQMSGMTAAPLADPTVTGRPVTGLANAWG
jgi:hypothetical protein